MDINCILQHDGHDLTTRQRSSAMGKSRSATIIMAYLMHKYRISRDEALSQLREGRPVCGPNDGFMEQLETYHRMLQAPDAVEAESIYQRWLLGRSYADTRGHERLPKL
jgi:dual specificity phosphatase 12